jgi:hypothetical protein
LRESATGVNSRRIAANLVVLPGVIARVDAACGRSGLIGRREGGPGGHRSLTTDGFKPMTGLSGRWFDVDAGELLGPDDLQHPKRH